MAYETDLEFARGLMVEEADDYLGDEMERAIEHYRRRLAETPVELEVHERPTVNVKQQESWVELRLQYLVLPATGDPRPQRPLRAHPQADEGTPRPGGLPGESEPVIGRTSR